ncbi:uncharacterized protein LOC129597798 [Paramacrobiotus metropolitanus]|uniref:uncharacterized protein LOC129597798 n=1 Tax=Paramacrobiotus metropolitanus TaxID=2943436 RepID=UPI002445997B|nr:uncharacterized protein LOC129597798 [Paramacrobiotus metropolitanus]
MYDVAVLVDDCFDFVMKDLIVDRDNADRCLLHLENALTWAVGIEWIVENCLHFVDVHCKEILKSDRFAELRPDTLRQILERDTLFADESRICLAVDRWAVAACTRNNLEPTSANRCEVLGDLFYLIRFPVMTIVEVADVPENNGLLEASALKEIRHHKHRFPTEPRQAPVIHIGNMEFRHKEEIFVEREESWCPAVVVGTRGSEVLYVPANNTKRVCHVEQEKIIRASDILAANQHVLHRHHPKRYTEARYARRERDYHITVSNTSSRIERRYKFNEIFLKHSRVKTWKRANEKGNAKDSSAPGKKRSLETADLG